MRQGFVRRSRSSFADAYASGACIRYFKDPANAGVSPGKITGGRSSAASTLISPILNNPEWLPASALRQGSVSNSGGKKRGHAFQVDRRNHLIRLNFSRRNRARRLVPGRTEQESRALKIRTSPRLHSQRAPVQAIESILPFRPKAARPALHARKVGGTRGFRFRAPTAAFADGSKKRRRPRASPRNSAIHRPPRWKAPAPSGSKPSNIAFEIAQPANDIGKAANVR